MDYKLLCTKCEQIALKCHSYVDKSILVEKSSSAWEEVKKKAVHLSPLMPHTGSSFTEICPRLYSPIRSFVRPLARVFTLFGVLREAGQQKSLVLAPDAAHAKLQPPAPGLGGNMDHLMPPT